ncbi:unnamed protein product [Menidia menidia]|uniref:(Atlantic silverside) hypothetical protein n=1 Tax=Menidia menidia TaxID=238744 RepID=A0A8S4B2G9_9TELE|nr:unnamed protein product [Menidia menidia]
MHQTFDPNRVVADSRRQVNNHNVCLTVDCLFYEGKLLKCSRNDISWGEIQKLLNIPISEGPTGWMLIRWFRNHRKQIALFALGLTIYVSRQYIKSIWSFISFGTPGYDNGNESILCFTESSISAE